LKRDVEVRPDSTMWSTSDEPQTIDWSCDVLVGRTTYYDVDASAK
jgi:hypothetical protein